MENDFLRPECPWTSFKYGKVISCEQRYCSWVRQPLNTYTSVVFFLVAAIILRSYRRERRLSDLVFGLSLIWMGVASVLNHASQVKIFVTLDFLSIYMLAAALLILSLRRLGRLRWGPLGVALYLVLVGVTIHTQYFNARYSIPVTVVLLVSVLVTEVIAARASRQVEFRSLWIGMGSLALGAYCYYRDAFGEDCVPTNHFFQWHSVWHFLSVGGLYFFARYYRQFYPKR